MATNSAELRDNPGVLLLLQHQKTLTAFRVLLVIFLNYGVVEVGTL